MKNSMLFDIDNYGCTDNLMQDVIKVIQVLTNNDYTCKFYYQNTGIYALEFEAADIDFEDLLLKKENNDLNEELPCGDCCNDNKIYG